MLIDFPSILVRSPPLFDIVGNMGKDQENPQRLFRESRSYSGETFSVHWTSALALDGTCYFAALLI